VEGQIEVSEILILKATAAVHGDIIAGKLVVEPGLLSMEHAKWEP